MAEELPVDLRTRRPQNPPKPPQKSRPETSLPLRKRRSAMGGFGGGGGVEPPRPLPLPNPQNRGGPPGKFPKLGGVGAGLKAEPALGILGGGLGVAPPPPPPILGPLPPNFGVPPEPPLGAAIAAATRQDEDGDTPLHIAVAQGALAVARRLVALFLRGGRDLDVYNHLRQTPLHLAVITGQVSLVRLLVAQGASPMAPDRLGRTCAHLACAHLAAAGPRPRILRELLRGPGGAPDLQARDYEGLTPLHVAVASGSRESVLVLLEHGADVDAVDIKSGRSALLHAVESGSEEMAELLLQHGASVNSQSYSGCTALHAAAARGRLRLLRLLLRCGADCGLRNLHNDTAAGVALNSQEPAQRHRRRRGAQLPGDRHPAGKSLETPPGPPKIPPGPPPRQRLGVPAHFRVCSQWGARGGASAPANGRAERPRPSTEHGPIRGGDGEAPPLSPSEAPPTRGAGPGQH
ncbi:B-cell lymphoma 3 protein [Catharus ustulatus]|uniref:B-cell lymphoma 3 protein n=1 Tax=Catharus ustulatus TaxID=91951 RepID=UPI00140CB52C|nr:B-cell lymphoma 3 protein [Catharus ustulatus]